jgi:hypothetical protein
VGIDARRSVVKSTMARIVSSLLNILDTHKELLSISQRFLVSSTDHLYAGLPELEPRKQEELLEI